MTNSEKALKMHEEWHGKIETCAKSHVNSREDLAILIPECCRTLYNRKKIPRLPILIL